MKRIGILTAGGDTPALNATIHGAVVRANELKIELYGFIKGFNCFFNPRVPHVHLNPLFQGIPELDPTKGGTLIGSSRDYVDPDRGAELDLIAGRLQRLNIDGLIAIGGDGTLNGLQPLAERLPTVLAPKTIDNDLGLNYPSEPDEWVRRPDPGSAHRLSLRTRRFERHVRPQSDRQLCDPGLCDGRHGFGTRYSPGKNHSGKSSADRNYRSHGPEFRIHRPWHRIRPARHHSDSRTTRSIWTCSSSG